MCITCAGYGLISAGVTTSDISTEDFRSPTTKALVNFLGVNQNELIYYSLGTESDTMIVKIFIRKFY